MYVLWQKMSLKSIQLKYKRNKDVLLYVILSNKTSFLRKNDVVFTLTLGLW